MSQLEELWKHCDDVFAKIPISQWRDKFGRHWEFMDVLRHLAYFDRTIVAGAIMFGASLPPEKRLSLRTHRDFNEWNERMMAEYRHPDSLEHALQQMREGRDTIRQAVASLDHQGLEQLVWFPVTGFAGWRTIRYVLGFCRQHTWVHFTQLCLRLKLAPWKMSAHIIHDSVDSIIRSLSSLLDDDLSRKTSFSALMIITGPGNGYWSIKIAKGVCLIAESEDVASQTDLVLTLSPETLIEILSDMTHPLVAVFSGRLHVQGLRHLPIFLQLFHRPDLDKLFSPLA